MERVLLTDEAAGSGGSLGSAPAADAASASRAADAAPRAVIRLRSDAALVTEGGVEITGPAFALRFKELPEGVVAALSDLASRDVEESELTAKAVELGGFPSVLRLQMVLRRLDAEGLLDHAVLDASGAEIARARPVGRAPTMLPTAAPATAALSPFAVATVEGGSLVVRAPHSHLVVELPAASASLLVDPNVPEVSRLFAAAGLLTGDCDSDDCGGACETSSGQWHAADWWFHARSRNPRLVSGYGGTYRNAATTSPLPAVPEARGTRITALPVPAADAVADLSLTDALESRRSIREHDSEHPITIAQLSELLHRTARLRGRFVGSDGQELADRPYPSGGAVHELEVYPLVTDCEGLDPGLWHYRTDDHTLELVAEPGPATAALVAESRTGAVMEHDPQVTLLVAARFGRVFWKYETVAYPLILKHVGVLYQTIYLVATAMGLAVCGLGGGDASSFARATGLDPWAEGTVGELVLGSRPAVLKHALSVSREPQPRDGTP